MKRVIFAAVAAALLSGTAFAQDVLDLFGPGSRIGVRVSDTQDAVRIDEVTPESPAARAGFQVGDVIVSFDGQEVRSARQFSRIVAETRPGRAVAAVVTRGGARQTLNVTPEEATATNFRRTFRFPDNLAERAAPHLRLPPGDRFNFNGRFYELFPPRRLGVDLLPLSTQLAEYFGVKSGVLVASVDSGSPASRAGLRSGDVITQANGAVVDDPSDVTAFTARGASAVEFRVTRDRKELTLKATF